MSHLLIAFHIGETLLGLHVVGHIAIACVALVPPRCDAFLRRVLVVARIAVATFVLVGASHLELWTRWVERPTYGSGKAPVCDRRAATFWEASRAEPACPFDAPWNPETIAGFAVGFALLALWVRRAIAAARVEAPALRPPPSGRTR